MRERLHHLATVENIQNPTNPEFSRWADTRLDRWLVDWCLRYGKERSARMIAKERGIEVSCPKFPMFLSLAFQTLVDIELFSDIRRIEDALSRRSCTEALTWCSENRNALRKVKVRIVKSGLGLYSTF